MKNNIFKTSVNGFPILKKCKLKIIYNKKKINSNNKKYKYLHIINNIFNDVYKHKLDINLINNVIPIIPSNLLINIINNQKNKEKQSNIWTNSIFKDLPSLQSNNVGNVGEMLIQQICELNKIESCIDGTKTKNIGGGKKGDGEIKKKTIEIKTSHLGSTSPTFQHELGEYPWYADYVIFVDISPDDAYITIFKNFEEHQYKEKGFKCNPYFPTKNNNM